MKTLLAILLTFAVATPLAAQVRRTAPRETNDLSIRGVGFFSSEQFAAKTTFDAVFGESSERFFGGGVVVAERQVFFEVDFSRFTKTGQRAFLFNGQAFRLNIPLTATITPIEVTGGYRFRFRRWPTIIPYVGAGFGSYGYKETSAFSDPGEDIDVRHAGYLVVVGAEFRVHRWVGVAADVQYTHVPGILGTAGLSKDAGENDLGGTAIRVKVLVGTGR